MHILIVTLHVRASAQAVPLAAGCLKACLPDQLQKQTRLIDIFPGRDIAALCKHLLALDPAVIAFPLYVWNREQVLRLTHALRQQNPRLILLAGGPEASADSRNVMTEGALDGVIRGEGEFAFAALMTKLSQKQPLSGVEGFLPAGRTSDDNSQIAVCTELSTLPSPWLTGQIPLEPGCGVLWEVARGCQFNCAFCYDAKGHRGVRPLPFARLRKELQLFAKKQVSQIWILDSTFNAPPERGRRLLGLLLEVAPNIHYHIEAKADFLNPEIIELLSQLSCSVQIGLQSADPQVLKPLHRNLKPAQMERQLRLLTAAGITFGLDLIYGLPGDNHTGFQRSLDFTLRQQPNQVDIFPLAVLPGTELFQKREEFGIQGLSVPPYLQQENSSYPPHDLEKSRLLAAATDIFYNRGRAVGFFLQICSALETTPSGFLNQFAAWLEKQPHVDQQEMLMIENWQPQSILPLQRQYVTRQLRKKQREELIEIAEDLINYHFLCAETLLAEDCGPERKNPAGKHFSGRCWKLNPAVKIQRFHYALEDLERLGGESLESIAGQLSPEPGYGIFLRQQGEIITESLADDFARMLTAAIRKQTTRQLQQGLDPQTAKELFEFAITQGLLLPII